MGSLTRVLVTSGTLTAVAIGAKVEASTISFDFSTDATQATIAAVYPDWAFIPANLSDAATVAVTGGQLRLGGDQADPTMFQLLTAPVGAFTLDVDLGAFPGDGSRNIGAEIGQNEIVFHPGFPGTALRVEGPGGFSNVDVGFTLAPNVLHHLKFIGDGLGLFTITLTSFDLSNTYTQSFSNPGSVGGRLSITRASVTGVFGDVYADNFVLADSAPEGSPVPEPSTLTLVGLGGLGLLRSRRKR